HGAVVADERQGQRQQIDDGPREMETASGDEGDVDAAGRGLDERVAVRIGQTSARIEQGAVDVYSEEPNHRTGSEVYAITASLHAPDSRTSVNSSTPCDCALPSRVT